MYLLKKNFNKIIELSPKIKFPYIYNQSWVYLGIHTVIYTLKIDFTFSFGIYE